METIKNTFTPKEESNIIKALRKFADYSSEPITAEECLKLPHAFFMDTSSVCLIEAVSERAKKISYKFINKEQSREFPNNILNNLKDKVETGSSFSTEYLLPALKLFDLIDGKVKLFVGNDFPIVMESKDFRVIIAPRVEVE